MAKLDRRDHPDVSEFTSKIRAEHRPLIGRSDLDDLRTVMNALLALRFPVNSAGELLDQLGGNDAQLQVDGVPMAVEIKLKLMPAYYFPIVSVENFVERWRSSSGRTARRRTSPRKSLQFGARCRSFNSQSGTRPNWWRGWGRVVATHSRGRRCSPRRSHTVSPTRKVRKLGHGHLQGNPADPEQAQLATRCEQANASRPRLPLRRHPASVV
jgi:hypothetical protein